MRMKDDCWRQKNTNAIVTLIIIVRTIGFSPRLRVNWGYGLCYQYKADYYYVNADLHGFMASWTSHIYIYIIEKVKQQSTLNSPPNCFHMAL